MYFYYSIMKQKAGGEMDIRVLNYFLMVAREENITRASQLLHITQPTLSHHMKILCDNGIVNVRKEGKWSHYSYSDNIDITLINMISSIFTSQEDKQ